MTRPTFTSIKWIYILSTYVCLSITGSTAIGQCETINGKYPATTAWQQTNSKNATTIRRYIYDDGRNIRLANISDNHRVNKHRSSHFNSIVKSKEPINLFNQKTTIAVVYKQGNSTLNFNRWTVGLAFNIAFPGAGYNQVNPSNADSYKKFWLANIYGQGNLLYVNTASGSISLSNAPHRYVLTYGDSIIVSLLLQPDGTAALHVVAQRIIRGVSAKVLDVYCYNAVTAKNVIYSRTNPIYPVLNILNGAVNLGCLKTERIYYNPIEPIIPECEPINNNLSRSRSTIQGYSYSDEATYWKQTNSGGRAANSYIYDDGLSIRLALRSNKNRLGNNYYPTYNNAVKLGDPAILTKNGNSSITITYKKGNTTQNFDHWVIGWTTNPNFAGAAYHAISRENSQKNYKTRWLANIYVQGGLLFVNGYSSYTEHISGYTPTYGDVITASLEAQPDGTAALHIVVVRADGGNILSGGKKKEVLNFYAFNAVSIEGVNQGPVYPVLNIITGATNLDCLSCRTHRSLPLTFGSIEAVIKKDKLFVSWKTLKEMNVSHFEIESSKDGKRFFKIGEVKSKAPEGKSDNTIQYDFSVDTSAVSLLLLGLIFPMGGVGVRRLMRLSGRAPINGFMTVFVCVLLYSVIGLSCNKSPYPPSKDRSASLFIRIKQVDKDGEFKYSKKIKAVNKQ